jgi:hypothetical protein
VVVVIYSIIKNPKGLDRYFRYTVKMQIVGQECHTHGTDTYWGARYAIWRDKRSRKRNTGAGKKLMYEREVHF